MSWCPVFCATRQVPSRQCAVECDSNDRALRTLPFFEEVMKIHVPWSLREIMLHMHKPHAKPRPKAEGEGEVGAEVEAQAMINGLCSLMRARTRTHEGVTQFMHRAPRHL